ncbi:hypothetical protein B566_EDAN015017 [Ephemera danica]|nr:hypothetical protein B566_EDAN015017 [Ephemera danica]
MKTLDYKMSGEKKGMDLEGVEVQENTIKNKKVDMPKLPKPLSLEEKRYLLAVERGDTPNVRKILQKAFRKNHIDINCMDSLGRGALLMAIDNENLEMVELLVVIGVATKDSLLHAINVEFIEAVELLLQHEELIHKEGQPHSWESVDTTTATFAPDITPLTLAAHRDNFEIIKMLLDRGATLPMPHDVKCGCEECIKATEEDSLRHSLARVNAYRALASPSLIALSSNDPILTAFELSWELRNLAFTEQECKSEYLELRRQCQQFAVDLLSHTRGSKELAIVLNHDPNSPPYEDGEHMKLARLELAINYKQKKFVAHSNIQQLLAALWYEGVPGFRRLQATQKIMEIVKVAALFPFYCMLYMFAPECKTAKLMRKPFMKFLIHASSYLFFLLLLILVSQRAEVLFIEILGTESMKAELREQLKQQRGNGPTMLEMSVVIYVAGFICEETKEIAREGIGSYLRNMWNIIDFTRNSLYVAVIMLRVVAYTQQWQQIQQDPQLAFVPREHWDDFDPQLIAEGLFAAANVFSALKLVHLFSINPHLGPLQISLGRMVIDIVKFFFIYSLVLLPNGMADWANNGEACMKWRRFGNLFESSQSLFWASFGMVGLDAFELTGIKSYTRFWGLLMFGSYSVINVIVLLNLLIAMMSNSYAAIVEHADVEWKFARTRLWLSYFEESATLPPPFNIIPAPKHFLKLLGLRDKDKMHRMSTKVRKERAEKERHFRYTAVMRALVWRYVAAQHRKFEENPVTEDDINEVKSEITAMRYEILEVLGKNGMDVGEAGKKDNKVILGKKMKVWERRLMKDFQVAPVAGEETVEDLQESTPPENEDSLAKFRRLAKLAVLQSSSHKWGEVMRGVCKSSQIGMSCNKDSYRNQQYLQRAMEEAQKLKEYKPKRGLSPTPSPIPITDPTREGILSLIKQVAQKRAEAAKEGRDTKGTLLSPRGSSPTIKGVLTQEQDANKHQKSSANSSPPKTQSEAKQQTSAPDKKTPVEQQTPLGQRHESPPKVIKRKQGSSIDSQRGEEDPNKSIAIPRPRPTGDARPTSATESRSQAPTKPTESDSSKSAAADKDKPKEVKPERKSAAPKIPETTIKSASPEKPSEPKPKSSDVKPKPVEPSKSTTMKPPTLEVTACTPLPQNKFSSTEKLLPECDTSPEGSPSLQPGKKVDNVATIKRQPKTGWL